MYYLCFLSFELPVQNSLFYSHLGDQEVQNQPQVVHSFRTPMGDFLRLINDRRQLLLRPPLPGQVQRAVSG